MGLEPSRSIPWKPPHPAFVNLLTALLKEVSPVYVVGGTVRDFVMGKSEELHDLDIVIDGPALSLSRKIADKLGWAFYPMDAGRDIGRLVFAADQSGPLVCDISRMRDGLIDHDLRARDFTVNAMALEITRPGSARFIDLFNGQEDLAAGVLRRVSSVSLAEDPVRLLRAVRLITQFDLTIEPATQTQIERLVGTVRHSSPERTRDELWKMLSTARPDNAIRLLHRFGLLSHVLPEVASTIGVAQSPPHYLDVFDHTLRVIRYAGNLRDWILGGATRETPLVNSLLTEALGPYLFALRRHFADEVAVGHTRAEWLVWHALLHDVGKPATASVESPTDGAQPGSGRIRFIGHETVSAALSVQRLDHLRFSRHEIALAETVAAHHMRPHHLHDSFHGEPISRRALFRFYRDVGGRQFQYRAGLDVLILALADYLGARETLDDDWQAYLAHAAQSLQYAFSQDDPLAGSVPPLADGRQLMTHLGLQPGKQLGHILDLILEAQAAGEIYTRDEALALARRLSAAEGIPH